MKYIGEVFFDRRRDYLDIRNEYYKKQNINCDLVMIGDSITEGFNLSYAGSTNKIVVNSGISGDRLKNIHLRLKRDVIDLNPTEALLMAGINDLLSDEIYKNLDYQNNIDQLFDYYQQLIMTLLDNQVKPICAGIIKINQFEHNHMFKNEQIEYFNNLLEKLAKKHNLKYIDFNKVLGDEYGSINTTYFSDGLHPNEKGYFEMFKYLRENKVI